MCVCDLRYLVQLVETLLDGFAWVVFEHAAIHQARFVFVPIEAQDGIARHAQTGVDAQNAECVSGCGKRRPHGRWVQRLCGCLHHLFFGNVEIGIDVLHVFVILERFHKAKHLFRLLAFELHR